MTPEEAVYRALTGRSPRTGTQVTPATLRELERAYGGVSKAAAAAGVGRETWRRWRLGTQQPKPANLAHMLEAVRRSRLAAGRRRRLLHGRPMMHLAGDYSVSSDNRFRELDTDQLRPSTAQVADMIDAYERGSAEGMAAALQDIVGNYVPGMTVSQVERLWIGSGAHDGAGGDDDE